MSGEAFLHAGDDPEAASGGGGGGGSGRDYFTPLWKTKGAHSFEGGLLQPAGGAGGIPGSNLVESEGFVPLRKVGGVKFARVWKRGLQACADCFVTCGGGCKLFWPAGLCVPLLCWAVACCALADSLYTDSLYTDNERLCSGMTMPARSRDMIRDTPQGRAGTVNSTGTSYQRHAGN